MTDGMLPLPEFTSTRLAHADFSDVSPALRHRTGELVGLLRRLLNGYVALPDDVELAIVLWLLHTWVFHARSKTPYLWITSAVYGSGKSSLSDFAREFAWRPWKADSYTEAVLADVVGAELPQDRATLFLDEADTLAPETQRAMQGVLNGGFDRDGRFSRMMVEGKVRQRVEYPTYAPKVVIGKGASMTLATRQRSIRVPMIRATRDVAWLDGDRGALRNVYEPVVTEWAQAAFPVIAEAGWPKFPFARRQGRERDKWGTLLLIAQLAGDDVLAEAQEVAVKLRDADADMYLTPGERLIEALVPMFREHEKLTASEIANALLDSDDDYWQGFNGGDGVGPRDIGKYLREFGISTHRVSSMPRYYSAPDVLRVGRAYRSTESPVDVEDPAEAPQAPRDSGGGGNGEDGSWPF